MHSRLIALGLVLGAACGEPRAAREATAARRDAPVAVADAVTTDAVLAQETDAMTDTSKTALSTHPDPRVQWVVDQPVPDDVVLSVAVISLGKSPAKNYRWHLTGDGAIFFARHSGKGGDWQVPFDQPLPSKPSMTVKPAQVAEMLGELERAGFFAHPGYEQVASVRDGGSWIIRARRGGEPLKTVVYDNAKPAFHDYLWGIVGRL